MFITSTTTAVAFLANYFSALLPISTFGVYAAIIVIANFFLALTFFPAVILLKFYKDNFGIKQTFFTLDRLDLAPKPRVEKHVLFERISEFYGTFWSQKIIAWRVPIVILFTAWLCFASYQSAHWKSLSKEEEYLPTDHFIIEGKNILIDEFSTQLEGDLVDVDIIFGVIGLDSKAIKWWDPSSIGKPIWDQNFNIYDPATQIAHVDLSNEIRSKSNFVVDGSLNSWILEF